MNSLIENITLYDLMAEEMSVWIAINKKFGFDLTIEGDNPTQRAEINGIHPHAMESFSDFCRRFLHFYDRLKESECF